MGIADRLKRMDAHSSVSSEFRVHTVEGALLSMVTLVFIAYLVTTEFLFNFQVTLKETVHVNATSPEGLEVEFDMTLTDVPCSKLNVDANDGHGQRQSLHLDGYHHVWKHRMKKMPNGRTRFIGDRTELELGSTLTTDDSLFEVSEKVIEKLEEREEEEEEEEGAKSKCGDCYGAGEEGQCCNTCEEVKKAYKRKGWSLNDVSKIRQCQLEIDDDGEGCNIHGKVALSSGGGNFHLAPGRAALDSHDLETLNVFDMLLDSFHEWNVSHTIHKLRFGDEYPQGVYQLDKEKRTITDGYGMYQYYFQVRQYSALFFFLLQNCVHHTHRKASQVVPTTYRFLNGTVIETNQYSVTEHLRHVAPGSSRG